MNLKNKIFFSAGLILFLSGTFLTLSFFLLLKKDLPFIKEKIVSLFTTQTTHEECQELSLFKEYLDEEKEQLNGQFLVLHPDTTKTWTFLAQTLATHPNIGLAQWHRGSDVFTVVPSKASFHPISTFAMNDRFFFVIIAKNDSEKVEEDNLYLAYPIAASSYGTLPAYLLFPWKEARNEMKDFLGSFADKSPISLPKFEGSFENTREKLELLNTLAPFYESGLEIFPGKPKIIPQGIALFSGEGKGRALVSSDLFHKELLFEDKTYFEKHGPKSSFLKVAESSAIITSVPSEIYLGNVAHYENGLLTLGMPLSSLLKKFAKTTHQNVILTLPNHPNATIGYKPSGEKLTREEKEKDLSSFSHISLLPRDELTLSVWPEESLGSTIVKKLDDVNQSFLKKMMGQTIFIWLLLLLLALLAWHYLAKYFTAPLLRLVAFVWSMKSHQLKVASMPIPNPQEEEVTKLTMGIQDMMAQVEEKDKIRSLLNRVVSKEIAEEILKSDPHLGGEDRVITILFADIRNFTELSQNLPPQKIVGILNSIMTIVSRIIEGEGGVIDKYVGDEVMALFGAPVSHPDHALRALSTAKLIIETLRNWNQDRLNRGEKVIEIGIGINTGLVVAGNMGAEDRLNYTVVGPSVNLASRLCKAALPMQIIVSEFTLEEPAIKESFYVESLPDVILKGFSDPVKVFQVTGFKWEST